MTRTAAPTRVSLERNKLDLGSTGRRPRTTVRFRLWSRRLAIPRRLRVGRRRAGRLGLGSSVQVGRLAGILVSDGSRHRGTPRHGRPRATRRRGSLSSTERARALRRARASRRASGGTALEPWSKMGGDSTAGAGRVPTSIAPPATALTRRAGAPRVDDGPSHCRHRDPDPHATGSTGSTGRRWASRAPSRRRRGRPVRIDRLAVPGRQPTRGRRRARGRRIRPGPTGAEDLSRRTAPAVAGRARERLGRNARLGRGRDPGRRSQRTGRLRRRGVIPHALECDAEAAGAPPNGRTGGCSAGRRGLKRHRRVTRTRARVRRRVRPDGSERGDPFTGGFRSGRCLCACDDAGARRVSARSSRLTVPNNVVTVM